MYSQIPPSSSQKYFILYDLETSRKEFLGQILTAYFTVVDQAFIPVKIDLNLTISISCLELPDPDAILTNQIYVLQHQKTALDTEYTATQKIYSFLNKCIDEFGSENIKLLGYNSSRFDLPFLRTTLIRNGFNPYFKGKLLYSDGLHLIRKIAWEYPESFPFFKESNEHGSYFSFRLEKMCQTFKILKGKQIHDAKEDVELLRLLLQTVQKKFSVNLWNTTLFELPSELFWIQSPAKPQKEAIAYQKELAWCLDQEKNNVLLVYLNEFDQGMKIKSIHYKNKSTGYLFPISKPISSDHYDIVQKAKKELGHINCDNFFQISDCDIEQDIYRLSFSEIKLLHEKIQSRKKRTSESQDLKHLWRRYNLRNFSFEHQKETHSEIYQQALHQYIEMRYIRGIKMNKFGDETVYSQTWYELKQKLKTYLTKLKDKEFDLMNELNQFYEASTIEQMSKNMSKQKMDD